MTQTILVAGGAGYIGSHMVELLYRNQYQVIVVDNLSTGHVAAIPQGCFIQGDIGDKQLLQRVFSSFRIDAIMHFASFIQVRESVVDPAKYYQNNVTNTLILLDTMLKYNIKKFIFSSSAAVYGNPLYTPIDENHSISPINPYGMTKHIIERVLKDYVNAYDFQCIALRYFNAAGVNPQSNLQERHEPETHLIPLLLEVAIGKAESIQIYGNDYDTPDGTCIRDYIHVVDLCIAHLLALKKLNSDAHSLFYNLGTGNGHSIYEVIDLVRQITQHPIPVVVSARRSGDPAILIADATKANRELEWYPQFSDLKKIISDVWQQLRCAATVHDSSLHY